MKTLDPAVTDPALLAPAFEPLPAAEMAAYVVSTRVNGGAQRRCGVHPAGRVNHYAL
jgi:hypothetical protein